MLRWLGLFAGIASVNATGGCDPEVVSSAASDRFVDYVITHCLNLKDHGYNMRGEEVLGESACLTRWMLDHSSSAHPIPNSGECRQAFQSLVSGAATNWLKATHDVTAVGRCSYNSSTEELDITYACWLAMEVELREFRRASGSYIISRPCTALEVGAMTANSAYESLVKDSFALVPQGVTGLVPEITSVCYGCYESFSEQLTSYITDRDDAVLSCIDDPSSVSCRKSTMMENALAEFKQCSGGYAIDFVKTESACPQEDADNISKLHPQPYFGLAQCAFKNDHFCNTLDIYYSAIQGLTNTVCITCYKDFAAKVKAMADASELVVATCTRSSLSVMEPECIAILGEAFIKFMDCAGVRFSTTPVLAN